MSTKLTWDDLLIEDSTLDHQALLADWRWLVIGQFRVVAGSKFGDWFLGRPDGSIEMLDGIEGALRKVAASDEEFRQLINTQEIQEQWLLSELVLTLHEKGTVPGAGQCYSFRIPPILGGQATADNVEVCDLAVWMSLNGQIHQQTRALPPGTPITGFKVVE